MMTAKRLGRCLNTGKCGLAGERGPIPIAADAPFKCPECQSDLIPHEGRPQKTEAGKKPPRVPRLVWLSALLLLLLIIIGLRYDLFGLNLSDTPPLGSDDGITLVIAPATVRTGTSTVTYDDLAPMLWRSFLTAQRCPQVSRVRNTANTVIRCTDQVNPTVTISAPESVVNIAGTAMKAFDVLLTTDTILADALPGNRRVKPDAQGNVAHADVIGVDALVVIVHPDNPLARLSQPQLARIFLGLITDFADVGGRPGRIRVIAPAPGARADDRLNAIVPQWLPISPAARRKTSSDAIVAAVLADPAAIGLVERRAATAVKALAIGPAAGQAVAPTPLALISGDYPLARPVRALRFNHDDSPYETAFVAFARTPPGRVAITAAGFEPVHPESFKASAPAGAPAAYRALVANSRRVAINLRFAPNSLDLDPQSASSLDAVAARLAGERVAAARITVIGLSDPARADAAADAGNLARQIATMLAERGIDSNAAIGLGGAMPVAEPAQGNRNRRVELWISPDTAATTSASP